ncbi:MAG: ThuA domain-containing protein [Gaiellaceae bacterium]
MPLARASLLYATDVAPYRPDEERPDLQRRIAGVHRVLPQSVAALAELASSSDLAFEHVEDVRTLEPAGLERCRVLALFTIGETRWSAAQREQIVSRVRAGDMHVLAIHSATDSCHGWPEFGRLVGARFDGHPWTRELVIDVVDRRHPATRHLPDPWLLDDEIYLFRDLRPDAHVLLRLRAEGLDMERPGARVPEAGFPLAWAFSEGEGRAFYTSLGHFPESFEDVRYLGHLYGGLLWLLEGSGPATDS